MTLFNELFGPGQSESWKQLAKEMNGEFFEGNYAQPAKVEMKYKNWTILLDTNFWSSVSKPQLIPATTRIRAVFLAKTEFRLSVSGSDFFNSIAKFFGAEDVEVGYPEIDDAFVIKSNDPQKAKLLFGSPVIRESFLKCGTFHFETRDQEDLVGVPLPEGVHELYLVIEDIVTDQSLLKNLFELISALLDSYCSLEFAYPGEPKYSLK